MAGNKKVLLKNTIMLYILTFSNYLMSLIIVPYETRILGPNKYGLLGLSTAIMAYFQLVIDFGFLLSATEEVSYCREDKQRISKIFTTVTVNKIILSFFSAIILFILCNSITRWKENIVFLMLSFLSTMVGSFIPDYLYRGLEKMESITVRTVLIKLFFTIMIFVFVKNDTDYLLIPILQLAGNLIALLGVYLHLFFKLKIHFVVFKVGEVWERLKKSAIFFLSRIATTIYTVTNTVVLDFISGGTLTAFYTSADKLVTTAKNGVSPISDSLYPYMMKHRDFKLVKKVLLLIEPIIILGCAIVFIWAESLCIWFFGEEYLQTAYVLRALLPVLVFVLPSYIFGFPVLGAMGFSRHANYSVVYGSIFHIISLIILYLMEILNLVTLALATSVTEAFILIYRISVVLKNKKLLSRTLDENIL